jgi:AMP-binding enzyme
MYPGKYAEQTPEKAAAILVETGETLTYAQLEERSVRLAHLFRESGLRQGDVVALLAENNLRAFEVYWAALRSGLYITAVNHNLSTWPSDQLPHNEGPHRSRCGPSYKCLDLRRRYQPGEDGARDSAVRDQGRSIDPRRVARGTGPRRKTGQPISVRHLSASAVSRGPTR